MTETRERVINVKSEDRRSGGGGLSRHMLINRIENCLIQEMALSDESVKMGLKEEEVMWMLFREDLQGGSFDGSEEEVKIFQGVLCNNGVDSLSELDNLPSTEESIRAVQCRIVESFGDGFLCSYNIRCLLPCPGLVSEDNTDKLLLPTISTSEIEPDGRSQTDQIELDSQGASTAVPIPTALSLSRVAAGTVYQNNQRAVANEASTVLVPTSSPNSQAELKNLSQFSYTRLISQDKGAASPFAEIISDTVIQIDERELVPEGQLSTIPLQNPHTSPSAEIKIVNRTDLIEATAQGTSGITHKPLPTTPSSSEADQSDEPGTSLCSGTLDISKIKNPSLKDLCTHLRAHANRLLADCGYKLEVRRRKNEPERFKYFYRLPDGPVISHLPKSWISLGKLLQSSLFRSAFDKTHLPGRQWADINEFASDLLNTLTYVEKMLRDPYCGLTLSDQWFLLDPFMAVAWIERKIGELKKAVPLKAVQSTARVLDENEKMVLQRNGITNPLTYRRRCKKSLLPELSLIPEPDKKLDGANRPMIEGQIVRTGGQMTLSGNNNIVSTIIAGVEVPSASDLHKGPCSTEVEMHNATRLHASPVTPGEQIRCTSIFHVIPDKLSKVPPITTEDEVQDATQLHTSQITNGDEALHAADFSVNQAAVGEDLLSPAELHMNSVKIGDVVPAKKNYGGNSAILADDIPVRGTEMVNQTSQSTMQSSINSILEVPFATLRCGFDNIPIGATFTINQVSKAKVPQQPLLITYPPDVPFPSDKIDTHSQSMTSEVQPLIDQASLIQGTLSFDAISGFQMKEYPVTWAMYNPLQSRLKRKHMPASKNQESKPQKRSKKEKEMIGLDTKCETHGRQRQDKKQVSQFDEHDLLISAIITKKCLKSRKYPRKLLKKKPTQSQHSTDQTVQLGQTNTNSKKRFVRGARTVIRLLIDTGVVYVNRKIQYLNSKGNKVKQGKLSRNGVLCQCCGENFTISGFQVHANSESGNPGLNLFLGHGTPYVMCLFQAWSMEYKGRGERMRIRDGDIDSNNDICGLCGDGGELVCCDSCPSSFHESCLTSQQIPEDCWHCPSCRCGSCQQMICKLSVFSTSIDYLQCIQCDRRYHKNCMKDKNITSSELQPGFWFCGNQCQQVYSYMRSQVGMANYIGDGFYFSILRCDHGQTKDLSLENLVQLAENNMKLALALRITEECFFPIFDPRTGLDLIPLVLYNWRVKILGLDYEGFYTVVLEKDERIISVASIRLRGAMVAEMPLVATSTENRKQGMCRRLVTAIEEMLKLLKVKTLILCAMPSLVDTWTSRFGFVPIEDVDKEMLSNLSLIYIPGTVLLKKNLSTVSIEHNGDDNYHTSWGNEFYGAGEGENPFHLINENQ